MTLSTVIEVDVVVVFWSSVMGTGGGVECSAFKQVCGLKVCQFGASA
jgi:hypothetical protein